MNTPIFQRDLRSNDGNCMIYGCAAVAVICIVGVIVGALFARSMYTRFVESITDSEPIELQEVDIADADRDALIERVDTWSEALDGNGEKTVLTLTEQDINALIEYHEAFENARGNVYMTIVDSTIKGDFSWPLDDFPLPGLDGRFFNGSAEFDAELRYGRLEVYIQGGSVNGEDLPDEIVQQLKVQNLADDFNQNPEARKSLDMIESIEIQGDTIVITPVGVEAEAEVDAE